MLSIRAAAPAGGDRPRRLEWRRVGPVRSLSVHASYRCRHAGACCTSNWPIPVEADRLAALQAALASGRLRPVSGDARAAVERVPDAPADTPAILARHGACCAFFDDSSAASGGRCRIQSALGHDALPLACRQFPRVSVHDPRGTSVTLSHYCPTAAALLDADLPVGITITTNAAAFPDSGEYVGLDARQSLPPLLRPGLLMDWDAWWECERLAVELLGAAGDHATRTAPARLRAAVADVAAWSPPDGPLINRVRDAFAHAAAADVNTARLPSTPLVDAVFDSIPADVRPERLAEAAMTSAHATRRFLAAHAFANWTAHLGEGLEVWLRSIEAAAALIEEGAGVRQADLLLRHLADTETLVRMLAK